MAKARLGNPVITWIPQDSAITRTMARYVAQGMDCSLIPSAVMRINPSPCVVIIARMDDTVKEELMDFYEARDKVGTNITGLEGGLYAWAMICHEEYQRCVDAVGVIETRVDRHFTELGF